MSAAVLALVVALVGLRKPAQAVKLEMRGDRCRADGMAELGLRRENDGASVCVQATSPC